MLFDEFKVAANEFMDNLARVHQLVSGRLDEGGQEVDEIQALARAAYRRIEHIVDLYADNPTMPFGPEDEETNKFAYSLAICDRGGSAIIPSAISEMALLVRKLRCAIGNNRRMPLESIPQSDSSTALFAVDPVFRKRQFLPQPNLCFVLMPFREKLEPIFRDHVKQTVTDLGLICRRADDIFTTKPIMEDIWESINVARIIIADLTGRNPNVFYEVGIAHTLGKDVVLITQSMKDVPFDLSHLRCIKYMYTPPGMRRFKKQLESTIQNVLSERSDSNVKAT